MPIKLMLAALRSEILGKMNTDWAYQFSDLKMQMTNKFFKIRVTFVARICEKQLKLPVAYLPT